YSRWIGKVMIGSTAGSGEVNVACTNPRQSEHQWHEQRSRDEKDILGGEKIADHAQESRSGKATDRRKALIAPKPFGQPIVPNHPEADGGNARAKNPPSRALHDDGNRDPCEVGPQRNSQ